MKNKTQDKSQNKSVASKVQLNDLSAKKGKEIKGGRRAATI